MRTGRRLAALLAGQAIGGAGGWSLARGFYRRRVSIVCYHGVYDRGDSRGRIFGGVPLAHFRADMAILARRFDVVDLDTLLAFNRAGEDAGRPLLAVTFDDGLELGRSGAVDILAELGIVATMFVTTGCIGNCDLLWQHKLLAIAEHRGDRFVAAFNNLVRATGSGRPIAAADRLFDSLRSWPAGRKDEWAAELWQRCDMPPVEAFLTETRPYVDWDDLAHWLAAGHGIGCHSRSHPLCHRLTDAEIEAEIIAPADALRRRFGLASMPFAYPFGERLPPDREAAVAKRGRLSCMLGTGGLSRRGMAPWRLERADIDGDLPSRLFGQPVLTALAGMA